MPSLACQPGTLMMASWGPLCCTSNCGDGGPAVGLHLNRSKSLLFIPGDCDASLSPLPSDVPVVRDGFSLLLGCPPSLVLLSSSFCETVLEDRVKECLGVLQDMGDSHWETTLLCSCFALPKFSYILRSCPPSNITRAAASFDSTMREALVSILGGSLSEWSWTKASLPVATVVSTFGVHPTMPQLLSWLLSPTLRL